MGFPSETPLTPSRTANEKTIKINEQIASVVETLNREWALGLEIQRTQDSPNRLGSLQNKCLACLKYLCFRSAIDQPLEEFHNNAAVLYKGWVTKPKAERDVIPSNPNSLRPISPTERSQLLQLFYDITAPLMKRLIEADRSNTPSRSIVHTDAVDDRPVKLELPQQKLQQPKRSAERESKVKPVKRSKKSDEFSQDDSPFMKPALPQPQTSKQESSRTFDIFSRAPSESSAARGRRMSRSKSKSANTSFASSNRSSVFDRSTLDGENLQFTQETSPDVTGPDPTDPAEGDTQSSELYGGGFDSSTMEQLDQMVQADIASTDMETDNLRNEPGKSFRTQSPDLREQKLIESLVGVFPDNEVIPKGFFLTPLHVRYEILRVFLFTSIPLSELKLPPRKQDWSQYNTLWNILKQHKVMEGKVFPEKVADEVWKAASEDFRQGPRGITMAGSLRYNDSSTGPLFKFRLEPLKLDYTHRFSRRFGCDRFIELDIPRLNGWRLPKVLQDLPPGRGKTLIIEWLGNGLHLMRRVWVRFATKPKDTKPKKASQHQSQPEISSELSHRVYFFAIDGDEFTPNSGTPNPQETVETRSSWSVEKLLDWLRPTWENRHQPVHKLYARTALALSRNTATVVLERAQIIEKPDIRNDKGEVMTDGAGRLSRELAHLLIDALELKHKPSGFQGRLGGAKGFWSVDYQDLSHDIWIEVYGEQIKWSRSGTTVHDHDYNDPAHRTFEVNKCSGKLKPKDLNQQLMPILMDRAKSKPQMLATLKELLETCLRDKIAKERIAMNNPQAFRKWVHDSFPSITDRLKHGSVPYKGAIPDSLPERMNLLLDAGFEPLKLFYFKELAREAYERVCDDLKSRLNVTVPKSTYAFMVPDWTGSLQENEIYIRPSEHKPDDDPFSGFDGDPLEGSVLVARNPAHFPSDIQRVNAVITKELLGRKDIVVFSTKGSCLASKLSGGDYDGDQAWICWDRRIVDNFKNAEVPKCPDLVKEGFITKDTTTYEELVRGKEDPTSVWLNYCMEFSLEPEMVGICTKYKEKWCYSHNSINDRDAVRLSKLLSDLVDQAKSGFTFTDDNFKDFKTRGLKTSKVSEPAYMKGEKDRKSTHIIDRLTITADDVINDLLIEFNKGLPQNIPCWDNDLTSFARWANSEATTNREWLNIITKLKADLIEIKIRWAENMGNRSRVVEESKAAFGPILADIYERFQAIQPAEDTPLTRSLLESWSGCTDTSRWALLRASFLYLSYSILHVSKLVWWMGGIQLCHMKANAQKGTPHVLTPEMYAMLRPDSTFVKLRVGELERQSIDSLQEGGESLFGDDD